MTELAFTNSSSGVGLCVLALILAGMLAPARRTVYDGPTGPDRPAGRKGIMTAVIFTLTIFTLSVTILGGIGMIVDRAERRAADRARARDAVIREHVARAASHATMAENARTERLASQHRRVQREALIIAATFAVAAGRKGSPSSVGAMAMAIAKENGMTVPQPWA